MQTRTHKLIVLSLIVLGIMAAGARIYAAIAIKLSGSWSETIDASDLQAGAGSDLIDTHQSIFDQVTIDISGANNKNWRVDVKKTDTNWNSDFQIYVRRTSDGIGLGTVTGGTSYQEVTDVYQSLFSGDGNRTDISIQLKLTGVSLQIPPDDYSIIVYYTVVEQ